MGLGLGEAGSNDNDEVLYIPPNARTGVTPFDAV